MIPAAFCRTREAKHKLGCYLVGRTFIPCTKAASLGDSARFISQRPELEAEDDGAQGLYLRKPGVGGFAWRNFVRGRSGEQIESSYEFCDSLGKPGMSTVFSAYHRASGRKVALKIASKSREEDLKALMREMEFLMVTDHPHVVRLSETFEDEHMLCLVLEYCDGGDLEDRVRLRHEHGVGFHEAELQQITRGMLRAVAYCHAQSIVHRDLKPSNFMFTRRHLKLVDFGVSGVVPRSNPSARLLRVKTGTEGYIAPEIVKSRPYGPAADIFSLGATLYYMISGKRPVWLESLGMYSFPRSEHLLALSPEGKWLLAKLTAKDPKSRPSASEALGYEWLSREKSQSHEVSNFTGLDEARVEQLQHYGKRSKLQRCARTSMVFCSSLRDPELVNLESEFLEISEDHIGEINKKELKTRLRLRSSLEAANLLNSLDSSRQGTVGFSEWVAAGCSSELFSRRDGARRAFSTLDVDGDGLISAKDLLEVLPHVFSQRELHQEMSRYDVNGDGCIDFDEFCVLLSDELPEQVIE
eukprot:TRINITY_DN21132_c0_g1_i2.p1 TRINITY_DN21132_c0_g1~~TRINITY_DN21132_c0_g1_i2.p1  ORF type:complete len:536 (+),score=96.93 TRINITY_DN21132_c0_g1_i2:29-1609(+)